MSGNNKSRDNYIKQGTILAAASLLVRIIGMLYRFPMSNIIGEEGNGIYSVAFEIYDVMLIISSYSLPLAISKIISAKRVRKEHRNIRRVFKCSLIFAVISGGLAACVLFFGASFFESFMARLRMYLIWYYFTRVFFGNQALLFAFPEQIRYNI